MALGEVKICAPGFRLAEKAEIELCIQIAPFRTVFAVTCGSYETVEELLKLE